MTASLTSFAGFSADDMAIRRNRAMVRWWLYLICLLVPSLACAEAPTSLIWTVLYYAYKKDLWWFELVIMFQRLCLTGVTRVLLMNNVALLLHYS